MDFQKLRLNFRRIPLRISREKGPFRLTNKLHLETLTIPLIINIHPNIQLLCWIIVIKTNKSWD